MEKRLPNLFDWDYNKLFSWSREKIVHTYQTDETEKAFDEQIKDWFPNLVIDTPVIVKVHIANDTMNDDLRFGDCTTQGYIASSTDEFKELVKSTTNELLSCMRNLITPYKDNRRITSWWIIRYRKFRSGGYEGTIRISYDILSQPNERGASDIYRKYQYNLEFRTARKDFHF